MDFTHKGLVMRSVYVFVKANELLKYNGTKFGNVSLTISLSGIPLFGVLLTCYQTVNHKMLNDQSGHGVKGLPKSIVVRI